MSEQLSLIPAKLTNPKARKVILTELPADLSGPEPEQGFIESIKKYGFLQPIGLVENGETFQVAYGRRRIRAARSLGLLSIPALIYPQGWTPASVLTLIENTHRQDNLAAKLEAIDALRKSATPEEICTAVGISQPELNKAIKMLNELAPELIEAMREGRIKTTIAQKAAKLPIEHQKTLAKQDSIKAKDLARYEPAPPTKNAELLPEPESSESMAEEVAPDEIPINPAAPQSKVSKQSWKLQAKPLIAQLLQVVPEDEEMRQYIELLAAELKVKA
jgi:ParB/RepB/Spo0J family partition protein